MPNLDDRTEQIIAAFEEGLSVSEISDAFGFSVDAVHSRLERAGVASKSHERSSKEEQKILKIERVIALVRKGFRTKTISIMTGMSLQKVREQVEKSYIITRDHGGNEVLLPRHEKNKIERPRNKWHLFRSRGE